jgi:mRNA interferase RelE/StbE
MQAEFLSSFYKDLDDLNQKFVRKQVVKLIEQVEAAENLLHFSNVKKLRGHRSAYRFRVGDYRVGFFLEGQKVQFARVVHRKDIYKIFP